MFRKKTALLLAGMAAGLMALSGTGIPANPASASAQGAPAPGVSSAGEVHVVAESNVGATTTLGGTVIPFKEVTLTAQMPGRVEFISGVEGDWIQVGKVLVALDDDDLRAQQQALQAQYNNAVAALRNARVQYSRQVWAGSGQAESMGMTPMPMIDKMFTKPMSEAIGDDDPEVVRRAQIYQHGTQIDQAQSQVNQIQAQWQGLVAKIRDSRSVAPFDGVIISKHIEVGDTVQPGQPLLNFADTRNLQVKVDIPARLMPGIKKGQVIPAKLDVGDARINTRVSQIYPMADPQRHTVTVKLDLPQDAPGGPGMYAEVIIPDITTPVEKLPVVPISAVVWRGSLPGLYVISVNGQPELKVVRLGNNVDANSVSILSGVKVGERILVSPPRGGSGAWPQSAPPAKDGGAS